LCAAITASRGAIRLCYDGHEHHIGLRELREFDQSVEPSVELRAGRKRCQVGAGFRQGAILKDADVTEPTGGQSRRAGGDWRARRCHDSSWSRWQPRRAGVFADRPGGAKEARWRFLAEGGLHGMAGIA